MAIGGIGATGYTVGYETRRTERNTTGKSFSGEMSNVKSTQGTGITLHISNPEDGEAIGSMGDHDSSVTVYKTKDFDAANPVYKVKIWDAAGNVTERLVDISKIDSRNCDEIEMFTYSSHLADSGKCPNAQRAFMGAKSNRDSLNSGGSLFDKENWMDIAGEIMQMQYHAGNLKGYLDYKQFWDFMEQNDNSKYDASEVTDRAQEATTKKDAAVLGIGFLDVPGTNMKYGMKAEYAEDYSPDNPVIKVTVQTLQGAEEHFINIKEINPKNASELEMFALCNYADAAGQGTGGTFGSWQTLKYYSDNAVHNGYLKISSTTELFKTLKQDWASMVEAMISDYMNGGQYRQALDGEKLMHIFGQWTE